MERRPAPPTLRLLISALALACWPIASDSPRGRAEAAPAALPVPAVAPAGLRPDPDWRPREPLNGGQLALALRRRRVRRSVLYVGAHPGDENTRLRAALT